MNTKLCQTIGVTLLLLGTPTLFTPVALASSQIRSANQHFDYTMDANAYYKKYKNRAVEMIWNDLKTNPTYNGFFSEVTSQYSSEMAANCDGGGHVGELIGVIGGAGAIGWAKVAYEQGAQSGDAAFKSVIPVAICFGIVGATSALIQNQSQKDIIVVRKTSNSRQKSLIIQNIKLDDESFLRLQFTGLPGIRDSLRNILGMADYVEARKTLENLVGHARELWVGYFNVQAALSDVLNKTNDEEHFTSALSSVVNLIDLQK